MDSLWSLEHSQGLVETCINSSGPGSEEHVLFYPTNEVCLALREASQCMDGDRVSQRADLSPYSSSVEPVCVY